VNIDGVWIGFIEHFNTALDYILHISITHTDWFLSHDLHCVAWQRLPTCPKAPILAGWYLSAAAPELN
jgi:hypothetical protein